MRKSATILKTSGKFSQERRKSIILRTPAAAAAGAEAAAPAAEAATDSKLCRQARPEKRVAPGLESVQHK